MDCYVHYNRKGTKRCGECGRYICDECGVEVNKIFYCKNCVRVMAEEKKFSGNPGHSSSHGHYAPKYSPVYTRRRTGANSFLLFCFSAIPGLNYMYLGLLKRGMFFMTMFFTIIFLASVFEMPFLMFALFIEMCYSFFDGFRIRRNIIDGEYVDDSIEDITQMITNNKSSIITFSVILLALSAIQKLSGLFSRGMRMFFGGNYWIEGEMLTFCFGAAIMIIGCVILFKGIKKRNDNNNDYNKENNFR